MAVSIIVSLAALTFGIRCLFSGRHAWALPFLAVLGVFTPFQHPGGEVSRFPHQLISILDMVSLALFAASPMILKRTMLKRSTIAITPAGRP